MAGRTWCNRAMLAGVAGLGLLTAAGCRSTTSTKSGATPMATPPMFGQQQPGGEADPNGAVRPVSYAEPSGGGGECKT